MTIAMGFFDGLDALIEYYIPAAREYPIALVIYLAIFALPLILFFVVLTRRRKSNE